MHPDYAMQLTGYMDGNKGDGHLLNDGESHSIENMGKVSLQVITLILPS